MAKALVLVPVAAAAAWQWWQQSRWQLWQQTCSLPSGITEATVTAAPARTSTSVMHEVSMSSESSATGTSTFFCASAILPQEIAHAN